MVTDDRGPLPRSWGFGDLPVNSDREPLHHPPTTPQDFERVFVVRRSTCVPVSQISPRCLYPQGISLSLRRLPADSVDFGQLGCTSYVPRDSRMRHLAEQHRA